MNITQLTSRLAYLNDQENRFQKLMVVRDTGTDNKMQLLGDSSYSASFSRLTDISISVEFQVFLKSALACIRVERRRVVEEINKTLAPAPECDFEEVMPKCQITSEE